MTDVQKASGAVPSTLLVNTDGTTIAGDGSIDHVLRAIGGGSDLLPVIVNPFPSTGGSTVLTADKTNVTDLVSGGDQTFNMPPASSVPNGTLLISIFLNAQVGSTVTYVPAGSDVLHAVGSGHSGFVVPVPYGVILFVSDGASSWWEVI